MTRKTTTHRIVIPELESAPSGFPIWTVPESITLASYYGIKDTTSIAAYLSKPVNSLQSKAKRLGLYFGISDADREEIIRKIKEGEI